MALRNVLVLAFLGGTLAGCSMEVSLEQLAEGMAPEVKMQKAQLTGFVSGSSAAAPTGNGYSVESATGNYTNKLSAKTNGGYKVFISVQGNIVSN
ncbi:hypothetical protein QJS83_06895 [Bdellovibrio sp. 22V]|uniref:hypothetical protein n=1 Tax=Bdellovibrio TaxID=958 RepID=UPI0025434615|nr:hypothetical protein [Bdellovibrio sp. 22V]WII73598.1 hypothetical protein QJS83_06895 [Bdellovibrio sp. 22V]